VDTKSQDRKSSPAVQVLDQVWKATCIPMLPVGLLLWIGGIVLNAYWVIIAGTLTIALGAYKASDR